jgi:hypothetical protein
MMETTASRPKSLRPRGAERLREELDESRLEGLWAALLGPECTQVAQKRWLAADQQHAHIRLRGWWIRLLPSGSGELETSSTVH